ncbi:hypothetical protein O181_075706 [Austropuccinia psidii MF-1]|uniref:Uncharacterized protein n=1 Tax=Austropuccinia psidii MF-1 TaxID=1389203 RepID=A0A9Q3IAF4_9BASI|nr:hypothetical protein [Austropuccinia psidii MF-1]
MALKVTSYKQRELARLTKVGGPIPIVGRLIYSSSEVPLLRITTEGSDELDDEEVEVVINFDGHQSSTSPLQAAAKSFKIQEIPVPPRNFKPVLSTIPSSIPPPSPSPSTARHALAPTMRPSPIPQPRNYPMITSQQLQPVASSNRRIEENSPFPFPSNQVFQKREF